MLSKCCTQYVRKYRRPSKVHRTGKGQSSSQFLRRAVLKKYSNHQTIALISLVSNVMPKFLHARLQHYVNQEFPDIQAGFRKGRGTRYQIANIHWIIEKARGFQKCNYLWFINWAKAFDCVDHNKLESSKRDWSTRPSYLSPEKPACSSRSNSLNSLWRNWLIQDREKSKIGLSVVILFI